MQKSFLILVAAALIGLGVWAWRVFFPGPERVIRSRLADLAEAASFKPSDGIVPKALRAGTIPDYFTADAVVSIEGRGFAPQTFTGRDELREAAQATLGLSGLKVELLDINVTLGPDRQTAVAHLTGRATATADKDKDDYVVELNVSLKKVNGTWLIYRVETVKTLARNWSAGLRPGVPGPDVARRPDRTPALQAA